METFPEQSPIKATGHEKWTTFVVFLVFSALEIGLLVFGELDFTKWRDWLIVVGAIFCPVLTVIAGVALVKDWSIEKSDRVLNRTLGCLIGAPIATLVGVWVLTSFFGWFSTIPLWAAVIIVLLVILISRR